MNVGLPVRMLLCFYLITACFLVLPRTCETTEHILSLLGSWPGRDQTAVRRAHGAAAAASLPALWTEAAERAACLRLPVRSAPGTRSAPEGADSRLGSRARCDRADCGSPRAALRPCPLCGLALPPSAGLEPPRDGKPPRRVPVDQPPPPVAQVQGEFKLISVSAIAISLFMFDLQKYVYFMPY